MAFQKATRKRAKARVGLVGPAGSGKTFSALQIAFGMGGRIAVIDTENGSADLYADLGEYDVAPITPPFTVKKYLDLIKEAEKEYDIIIIDSLSHAWAGTGGLLEEVDKRAGSGNKFAAWRDITPMHNSLIDAILQSPAHIIATMRSKTEYVIEENDKGKKVPRKIGMAPVQREGMDYEFTLVFDIDQSKHFAVASKDRTSLFDGTCEKLSRESGERLRSWLESGVEAPKPKITRAHQKKLFAAMGKDVTPEALKAHFNIVSSGDILIEQFDDVLAWVEETKKNAASMCNECRQTGSHADSCPNATPPQ